MSLDFAETRCSISKLLLGAAHSVLKLGTGLANADRMTAVRQILEGNDLLMQFLRPANTAIKLFLMPLALLLCTQLSTFGADVNLSWNANSEPDLAGYKVYYGTASRSYSNSVTLAKVTAHTVPGLTGGTYYFAVTAYDTSGNESGFSNEVTRTITSDPPSSQLPAPANVRVK